MFFLDRNRPRACLYLLIYYSSSELFSTFPDAGNVGKKRVSVSGWAGFLCGDEFAVEITRS